MVSFPKEVCLHKGGDHDLGSFFSTRFGFACLMLAPVLADYFLSYNSRMADAFLSYKYSRMADGCPRISRELDFLVRKDSLLVVFVRILQGN